MIRAIGTSAVAALVCLSWGAAALAWGNNFKVTDGYGDQINIGHKWGFGPAQVSVQDRFGDGFARKKGFFGTRETDVNVLGNQLQRKKGWFGTSSIQGHSILGDTITTKKGILGYRTTYVNVHGVSTALKELFGSRSPAGPVEPPPMGKAGSAGELAPLGDPNALGAPGSPVAEPNPASP